MTSLRFIEWSMREGVLYNRAFTDWRHCVSQNKAWERGCYITVLSPSEVTAFHRMKHGRGGVIWPCFHRVTSLRFTEWSMGEGVLYNRAFTEWRNCVSQNEAWERGCYITVLSPSDVTAFHRMKHGGEGVLYNRAFTEWRHCVSQNEAWERGCYITVLSPSDVTAFHIMKHVVHGPDPEICIFVAPLSQLWFDGISRFPYHIGSHFHLLSFA